MKYRKIDKYLYATAETEARYVEIHDYNVETRFVTLWPNGQMFIWSGYAWNGSNCSFDKNSRTASLWHDVIYQLMRLGLIGQEHRKYADELYRDLCIEHGLWKFHANLRYTMLRKFGWGGAKVTGKKENIVYEE